MDYIEIRVKVERDTEEKVNLKFNHQKINDIVLSDKETNDLEAFFDDIFQLIIKENKLINFILENDKKNDLFYDVSNDIIDQLNSEIRQSEDEFSKIIELLPNIGSLSNDEDE